MLYRYAQLHSFSLQSDGGGLGLSTLLSVAREVSTGPARARRPDAPPTRNDVTTARRDCREIGTDIRNTSSFEDVSYPIAPRFEVQTSIRIEAADRAAKATDDR